MESSKKLYIFVTFAFLFLVVTYNYSLFLHTNSNLPELPDWHIAEIVSSTKYLWRPQTDGQFKDDRILDQLQWLKKYSNSSLLKNNKTRKKQILVFDSDHSYYSTDNKLFCPDFDFNYCDLVLSSQIKKPKNSMGNYDAVVFTQDWMRQPELHVPKSTKQIIYILESPNLARANLSKNNAILASYHRRSDITLSYGKWIPFTNGSKTKSSNANDMYNFSEGKTSLVAIFVSNCNAHNNRISYVQELQKYITVDIFGGCSNNTKCRERLTRFQCMRSVIQKYKFYLSFENSNCRDYITEKVYRNGLEYGAVPVVLGAHPDDYKETLPPHSYISVEDFESPQKLAEHLKLLDRNDSLYNKYFRWRETGELYFSWKYFFCHVCGMLFYADYVPPPKWESNSTWGSVSKCLPNNQWYWESREDFMNFTTANILLNSTD